MNAPTSAIFQIQSTLILVCFFIGLMLIKKKKRHVKGHAIAMIVGIVWDLLLILQIEFDRQAIDQAMRPQTNSVLLNFHILISVTTVLLYFFLLVSGYKLMERKFTYRVPHKRIGILAISLRVLVYITSFFVLQN